MSHYDPKKPSRIEDTATFLSDARDLYQFGLDADRFDREAAQADNAFANASDTGKEQWDPEMMQSRLDAFRPVLQRNLLPTYIQQVGNDGRQNKPAIKISPGDGGQIETADFFQNRIRHVEYECNADTAYDTTRDQQVTSGRGFLRVSWEYVQGTFRRRACIEAIENQFSVVWDPAAKEYDKKDAEWWFVVSRISKAKHERDYGKQSVISTMDFAAACDMAPGWIGVGDQGRLIQIAEYWRKEFKKRTLVMLEARDHPELGQLPHWKDELPEGMEAFIARDPETGEPIEREEDDATICQYIINGAEILSETEWIGSRIPIVPVWGRQAIVDGQRKTFSLIRNAKDMQRLVNLYVSNIAEQIAQMPKSPYLLPIGSMPANQIAFWQNASNTPLGYLLYDQYDAEGRPMNKPERIVNEPPIQALTLGLQQAIDGIKAAMGIFDASIGARSNETSGIAIQRRQKEADVTNFHFADNEARSRKAIGEILVEIIPLLDKPGSTVPVRTEDKKTYLVPIGAPHKDQRTGKEVTHNLTAGDYGVTVATGPSYDSARQEEQTRDADLIKAAPELMWVFGDKLLAADDTPGAQERAERMKKAIQMKTPGLIADPNEQTEIPPQMQAEMQAQAQKLAQTEAFAISLHQKLETEQPKLDNAVKIEQMKLDFEREKLQVQSTTQVSIAEIKAGIDADIELLRQELGRINQERGVQADIQKQESAQQHQATMADRGHAQALEQQASDQSHAKDMAESGHSAALEQQQQAAELTPEPAAQEK